MYHALVSATAMVLVLLCVWLGRWIYLEIRSKKPPA
jgi:hypothetical protein